jgi:DNA-binding NarL/FixJ family response regulator
LAPISVLIVDDFISWRQCICTLLKEYPEYQVIGEASDGQEAVEKSEQLRPDVILLDIGLPKLNGIEAARRICAIAPGSAILFVSENQCPDLVQEALSSGVCIRGYVLKSDAGCDLLPALEAVTQHKPFVSGRLALRILDDMP